MGFRAKQVFFPIRTDSGKKIVIDAIVADGGGDGTLPVWPGFTPSSEVSSLINQSKTNFGFDIFNLTFAPFSPAADYGDNTGLSNYLNGRAKDKINELCPVSSKTTPVLLDETFTLGQHTWRLRGNGTQNVLELHDVEHDNWDWIVITNHDIDGSANTNKALGNY